jgi:hypothetical protein
MPERWPDVTGYSFSLSLSCDNAWRIDRARFSPLAYGTGCDRQWSVFIDVRGSQDSPKTWKIYINIYKIMYLSSLCVSLLSFSSQDAEHISPEKASE